MKAPHLWPPGLFQKLEVWLKSSGRSPRERSRRFGKQRGTDFSEVWMPSGRMLAFVCLSNWSILEQSHDLTQLKFLRGHFAVLRVEVKSGSLGGGCTVIQVRRMVA